MRRALLGLVLTFSLLGWGKTPAFAESGTDRLVQKGVNAQKMGNYGEAFQWFQLAANAGSAEGQYRVGYCYLTGQGVRLDEELAVKWLHRAADQGDARSEFNLGNCYEKGWGVLLSLDDAKKWYQAAAQQGFKAAENALKRLAASSAPDGN
ncbi:MAG TPA: tetratricopeptide repeat protein [bacterium]|jgi:TPR repeat protein|nr:tetratricopeptide repeat protein [bacterium]